MLLHNRIYAWYDCKQFIVNHMLSAKINPEEYRVALTDEKIDFYIGFSKDLKNEFLSWASELKKMEKSGELLLLKNKYIRESAL